MIPAIDAFIVVGMHSNSLGSHLVHEVINNSGLLYSTILGTLPYGPQLIFLIIKMSPQ
jgi:hypothetical protein